jgi:putative drug exporter of the RND superfamily
MPRWLGRVLPELHVEGQPERHLPVPPEPEPEAELAAAGTR